MKAFFKWLSKVITAVPHEEPQPELEKDDEPKKQASPEDAVCGPGFGYYRPWIQKRTMPHGVMTNSDLKIVQRAEVRKLMFNFFLWRTINKVTALDYGFQVVETLDQNTWTTHYIGFLYGTHEFIDAFLAWEQEYEKQFPTSGIALLPELPDTYIISGTCIKHGGALIDPVNGPHDGCLDLGSNIDAWIWIIQNCNGRVWVTHKSFIFENDSDAVLYKLMDK